jgi:copper homeostasis protein
MTDTRPNGRVVVEAAVETVDAAQAAEDAGVDRLELCADLANGGITPDLQLIEAVRAATGLPVMVMVRPRPGNFVYSAAEIDGMTRDIEAIGKLEPAGLVTGAITADGELDLPAIKRLIGAAQGTSVTFHRAFDHLANPLAALESLIELGVDRILTSGGAKSASEAVDQLADLIERARGRIVILVGGGVRAHNVREIIERTGAREVHARFVDDTQMKGLVVAARD